MEEQSSWIPNKKGNGGILVYDAKVSKKEFEEILMATGVNVKLRKFMMRFWGLIAGGLGIYLYTIAFKEFSLLLVVSGFTLIVVGLVLIVWSFFKSSWRL
jgi:hypothetical protein